MLKNNPFVTIFLLFCIEVMLFIYLDYIDEVPREYTDFSMIVAWFLIPVISVFLYLFVDFAHKKEFKIVTILIVIASILSFCAMLYLTALAKAFQH